MKEALPPNRVLVEVDAPGVSPETVDSIALLRLAESYFELLVQEAQALGLTLSLRGLAVTDKCAAVLVSADSVEVARRAVEEAHRHVTGTAAVPVGLADPVLRVRQAVRHLPADHSARILAGRWNECLSVTDAPPARSAEVSGLRALLVRIGGNTPRARFASHSEERDFSLSVSHELARKLGPHIYSELQIRARLVRDRDGAIDSDASELLEFSPLEERDPSEEWKEWFEANASEWRDIEDIEDLEVALARD